DIFFANLVTYTSASCGADSTFEAGTSHTRSWSVANANALFPNSYVCSLSCERAWPGFPVTSSISVGPVSSTPVSLDFDVPDSAAAGVVLFTFQVTQPDGRVLTTCPLADTISSSTV